MLEFFFMPSCLKWKLDKICDIGPHLGLEVFDPNQINTYCIWGSLRENLLLVKTSLFLERPSFKGMHRFSVF